MIQTTGALILLGHQFLEIVNYTYIRGFEHTKSMSKKSDINLEKTLTWKK